MALLRTLEYYVLAVCAISMKLINILRLETPLKITENICTNPRWLPYGGSNDPKKKNYYAHLSITHHYSPVAAL